MRVKTFMARQHSIWPIDSEWDRIEFALVWERVKHELNVKVQMIDCGYDLFLSNR